VSHRTLVLLAGLTVGDYLLWNWSLNANHEVIALISGLTLPPLALLSIWRIVVAVGSLLARTASRPTAPAARSQASRTAAPPQPTAQAGMTQESAAAATRTAAGSGSRRIAA
jgi:hypothetical protein